MHGGLGVGVASDSWERRRAAAIGTTERTFMVVVVAKEEVVRLVLKMMILHSCNPERRHWVSYSLSHVQRPLLCDRRLDKKDTW